MLRYMRGRFLVRQEVRSLQLHQTGIKHFPHQHRKPEDREIMVTTAKTDLRVRKVYLFIYQYSNPSCEGTKASCTKSQINPGSTRFTRVLRWKKAG